MTWLVHIAEGMAVEKALEGRLQPASKRKARAVVNFLAEQEKKSAAEARARRRLKLDKAAFERTDLDGSGDLNLEEIKVALQGQQLSDAEITEIFAGMDTNSDGRVSLEEFLEAAETSRARESADPMQISAISEAPETGPQPTSFRRFLSPHTAHAYAPWI